MVASGQQQENKHQAGTKFCQQPKSPKKLPRLPSPILEQHTSGGTSSAVLRLWIHRGCLLRMSVVAGVWSSLHTNSQWTPCRSTPECSVQSTNSLLLCATPFSVLTWTWFATCTKEVPEQAVSLGRSYQFLESLHFLCPQGCVHAPGWWHELKGYPPKAGLRGENVEFSKHHKVGLTRCLLFPKS